MNDNDITKEITKKISSIDLRVRHLENKIKAYKNPKINLRNNVGSDNR